ncbi:MAG TPA: F0F1 ATP synthase subunit delta [Gammaproteobacteria bacterium]|nr:F0F1 ATP synthase subunit delta [Gammaproteobacteria bacterium]
MATIASIARPYAQAAYNFALAKKELPLWEKMLQSATELVQEPRIAKLLAHSRISAQQWFLLFSEILAPLNENTKNFLRLITENKRLSALPTILELFKEYEASDRQAVEVGVITALPLEERYHHKLKDKLTETLKQEVSLRCEVDENILGGALIRVGDKVIDGSIRGQLTRLLEFAIR